MQLNIAQLLGCSENILKDRIALISSDLLSERKLLVLVIKKEVVLFIPCDPSCFLVFVIF